LTERIAASDRRAAETLDSAVGKFARLTDALSDRQDHTATDLAQRIRQSEERTAKLLDEAREKLEQQAQDFQRKAMREAALREAERAAAPPPPPSYAVEPYAPPPAASFPESDEIVSPAPDPFRSMSRAGMLSPSASPAAAVAPLYADLAPPAETFHPAAIPTIDEPPMGAMQGLGSLSSFEANPFDPDDDFQAPTSGSPIYGPPPMSIETAPPPPLADALVSEPEEEPLVDFSVRDFVAAPEPERPSSTRDMLDQARAAAKRASGGRDSFKPTAIPAPGLEGAPGKPFGISFTSKAKKTGGGSTLRTVGLASVWACAITSAAVGAYSLAVKDSGGPSHGSLADAPTAATPAADDRQTPAANPQLAVALAPTPAPSAAAAASKPNVAASAGPISKTAAALDADVKSSTAVARPSDRDPAASAVGVSEKAVASSETARSLYDDSVRKIEAGDAGALNDLKRAANLGFAPAQFYLGRIYEAGAAGVPKDMSEARRWTQRAAQGGDPAAMYNLASYLYAGDGGPKDPAGAVEWFRKAAERGVVNSQYNLAQLYETGHGVTQNLAEAYKWYLVAAASGDPESKANVQLLKAQLPADVRATAERSAAAFHSQLDVPAHMAAAPGAPLPH
jgi:localization factor PodJL